MLNSKLTGVGGVTDSLLKSNATKPPVSMLNTKDNQPVRFSQIEVPNSGGIRGSQLNTQDLLADVSLSNLAADADQLPDFNDDLGGGFDNGLDNDDPTNMVSNPMNMTPYANAPHSFFDSSKFKDP